MLAAPAPSPAGAPEGDPSGGGTDGRRAGSAVVAGRDGGHRWAPTALAAVVAVAVSQTWFRPGHFVAGGDIPPFVRTALEGELGSAWNHGVSGAGSPSYVVVQAPEVYLIKAARLLGAGEIAAQRVLYGVLLALVAAGAVAFARRFTSSSPALALAGVFAVVNAFVLNQVPNHLSLAAMAAMGFTGALVVKAAQGGAVPGRLLAATTLGFSYLLTNPPLFAVAGAWLLALVLLGSALGGAGGTGRAARLLLRAAPWSLALNAWWIVPAWLTLVGSAGESVGAVTEVRAWAWTHARASVANILALNASWSWSYPEYAPFAAGLDRWWWGWLRFVPAVASLSAPLLARGPGQRRSVVLLSAALVLVLVAKGLHPPLGQINLWAYDRLPGWWLLREPATKAMAPLVLLYSALIAVAAAGLLERLERLGDRRWAATAAALAGAAAVVAYPYPVWNGGVLPESQAIGPTDHVRLPEGWRSVAAYLNARPARGKALVLPLADYYQVATTWGYYGTDLVPSLLLRRPTIQPLPESYLLADRRFLDLVHGVEDALVEGRTGRVPAMLRALGVSHVVVRHDLDRSVEGRTPADPSAIAGSLRRLESLRAGPTFGVADVFEVGSDSAGQVQLRDSQGGASLNWDAASPSRYSVAVSGAAGPFLVVLAETYDPGWKVVGLPDGATASHRKVDGYANGWLVDGTGDLRFTLEYAPDRVARLGRVLSLLAAVALVTVSAGSVARRRTPRRPQDTAGRRPVDT